MEVNRKKIPEKFYCEKCDARPVNAIRAKQNQEKYLKNIQKMKRRNSSSPTTSPDSNKSAPSSPSVAEALAITSFSSPNDLKLPLRSISDQTDYYSDCKHTQQQSNNRAELDFELERPLSIVASTMENNIECDLSKTDEQLQSKTLKYKRRYKTKTIREEFESKSGCSELENDTKFNSSEINENSPNKTTDLKHNEYSSEFLKIKKLFYQQQIKTSASSISNNFPLKLVKINSNKIDLNNNNNQENYEEKICNNNSNIISDKW